MRSRCRPSRAQRTASTAINCPFRAIPGPARHPPAAIASESPVCLCVTEGCSAAQSAQKKNATVEHGSGDELVDQICANLAAARVAT